ncbi:hypothetical protein ACSDR0_25160 [Streptosporangium sp. G11]|uniref:hypothetical protein n=1 Tax=Streptosporangium sp. G11 TaxID=3436926 RepID=UPI003EB6B119
MAQPFFLFGGFLHHLHQLAVQGHPGGVAVGTGRGGVHAGRARRPWPVGVIVTLVGTALALVAVSWPFPGVALILMAGVHLVNRDDPEKANRPVTTPAEEDDTSNAKIIDKDQRIDIDTFDQKDSPLWPLVEQYRRAVSQNGSTATDSNKEE